MKSDRYRSEVVEVSDVEIEEDCVCVVVWWSWIGWVRRKRGMCVYGYE